MSKRSMKKALVMAAALGLSAGSAMAVTTNWTNNLGTGDGNWNTLTNWTGGSGIIPTSADDAVLDFGYAGSINLGPGGFAKTLAVNDNYALGGVGGTLTIGDGLAPATSTNGLIRVADPFTLTLAPNTLVVNTVANSYPPAVILSSGANNPGPAALNGTVILGVSQTGLNGKVLSIGDSTNGVILEMPTPLTLGTALIKLDGGNFQFAGQDAAYSGSIPPLVFTPRNDVNMLRITSPGPHTVANDIAGDSPFKYLLVDNGGNPVTFTGNMIRTQNANNTRGPMLATWNNTLIQVGAPTPGGNPDYPVLPFLSPATTDSKAGLVSVAAIKGNVEVYRANADTFALFGGGTGKISDSDAYMGMVTGVRGQDLADVAPSSVIFFNQAEGGAIATGGVSVYRYASLVNESARYQVPRGGVMIPLTIDTHVDTEVRFNMWGNAGIGLDVRGDIIKTGPGTMTMIFTRGSSGTGTRGGVTPPINALLPTYLGQMFINQGTLGMTSILTGRTVDDVFDGGTGSDDEAGNGVVNYFFANGTTLRTNFTDTAAPAAYSHRSNLIVGALPTDVVTFQIETGGDANNDGLIQPTGPDGKSMQLVGPTATKHVAAQPVATFTINGRLIKTGTGQLILGSTAVNGSGGSRAYAHGMGSFFDVFLGSVNINGNQGTAATAGPTPAVANLTLTVGNPASLPTDVTTVTLGDDQDLADLVVNHAAPGRQTLDLASPKVAGSYRAVRVYSPALAITEANLWASIVNANMVGAIDPLDGIIDSSAADPSHTNAAVGLTDKALDAAGAPVVLLRLTRKGDANCDGTVGFPDLLLLSQNYNGVGKTWDQADFNYDMSVGFPDLLILSQNYNQVFSAPAAAAVPEPGVLSMLALAAAGMLARWRR